MEIGGTNDRPAFLAGGAGDGAMPEGAAAPPPVPSSPAPMSRVGPYRIEEPIGRGGMGEVYRAFHVELETSYALKVIQPALLGREKLQQLFRKEGKTMASLRHPNIVQVHTMDRVDDTYYLVMDYVAGPDGRPTSLRDHQRSRPDGALSEDDARRAILQVCDALEHAHERGVLHLDIKPGNVLLDSDGTARLTDFGLARAVDTEVTAIHGTLKYMAPEQRQHGVKLDERADVYALGRVMEELVPVGELRRRWLPVIERCTQEDRERRYRSASEVRDALLRAEREGRWRRAARRALRDPRVLAGAGALAVLAVTGFYAARGSGENPSTPGGGSTARLALAMEDGGTELAPGEEFRLEVRAAEDGWVTVLSMAEDGAVLLLSGKGAPVRAGEIRTLPVGDARPSFAATEPAGERRFIALACDEPIRFEIAGLEMDRTDTELELPDGLATAIAWRLPEGGLRRMPLAELLAGGARESLSVAELRTRILPEPRSPPPDAALELELVDARTGAPNRRRAFADGEPYRIIARPSRDCHVTLLSVDALGNTFLHSPQSGVRAGAGTRHPFPGGANAFWCGPPFGVDRFFAIASPSPLAGSEGPLRIPALLESIRTAATPGVFVATLSVIASRKEGRDDPPPEDHRP